MRVLRGDGSAVELDEKDILYFTTHKNIITVHTREEEFLVPTSLDQLLKAYKDLDFDKVDRSFIVNLQQVESIHPERKTVVFRDDPGKGRYVPVSEPNLPRIKKYIEGKKKPD